MSYDLIPGNIDWRGSLRDRVRALRTRGLKRFEHVKGACRAKMVDLFLSGKSVMKTLEYYEKVFEGLNCGRFGKGERYEDGSRKFKPFFCGHRHGCWDCFRRGRQAEYRRVRDRIEAVVESQGVSHVATHVYTLWPEIRDYISTRHSNGQAEIIREIVTLVVDSFKELIGLGGHRGKSVTGIVAVVHPHGSRNPFIPYLHVHLISVPIVIEKSGRIRKLFCFVKESLAKKLWFDAQAKFCLKYGIEHKQEVAVLHLSYVPTPDKKRLRHRLKYIFRSLPEDLLGSVKYVTEDLKEFVWLEIVDEGKLPHVASWEQFSSALDMSMNFPGRLIRSYGFFQSLKKYADILGLVPEVKEEAKVPVETFMCEFKTTYYRRFDKEKSRWGFIVKYWVSVHNGPWEQIDKSCIVGENGSASGAERFVPK